MIVFSLLFFYFSFQSNSDAVLTEVNYQVEKHIFNYDFDKAFTVLIDNRSKISPYRYNTYKSVINFYTYYSYQPTKRKLRFVDSMAVCLNSTFVDEDKILESGSSDDILMLGGAYGFRGMAKFIKKSRVSALLDADEAKDILDDLIEKDPNNIDAYFGIGIYNYSLSQPPAFLQIILMMMGFSGDYDTGIEQLNRVAKFGSHTKVQSILYLINHALYEDDHFKEVYPIFEELPEYISNSPMALYKKIQFEYELKKYSEVHKLYALIKDQKMPSYIENYSHYVKAQSFVKEQKPDSAIAYIAKIEQSRDYFLGGLKYDLRILKADYFIQKKEFDVAYNLYRSVLVNTTNDDRFDRVQAKIVALSNFTGKAYSSEK